MVFFRFHIYYAVFLCVAHFTQYDNLQVHLCCSKWQYFILSLWSISIPRCTYVPKLFYSFICRQTFRLLVCLGYWQWCCSELWGACIFLNSSFLQIYAQDWDYQIIWQFCSQFSKEPPYCSPQWLHQLTLQRIYIYFLPYSRN